MMTNEQLCIHPDYVQREDPTHFDDREQTDYWQDAVYKSAHDWVLNTGAKRVLDFGCGSGYKLMKYFSGFQTIGYEVEPALTHLRTTYFDREWVDASLHNRFVGDLLICSDVIEHILDLTPLFEQIKLGPVEYAMFSTPALELLSERGESPRFGKPDNQSHVREWTTREFYDFMSMHFEVLDQFIVDCRQGTQVVMVKQK